jgi:hypothetical protein
MIEYEITALMPNDDWAWCRIWARDFHEACEQGLIFARDNGRLIRIEVVPAHARKTAA